MGTDGSAFLFRKKGDVRLFVRGELYLGNKRKAKQKRVNRKWWKLKAVPSTVPTLQHSMVQVGSAGGARRDCTFLLSAVICYLPPGTGPTPLPGPGRWKKKKSMLFLMWGSELKAVLPPCQPASQKALGFPSQPVPASR